MDPQNVFQLAIRLLLAAMCAVLLVEGYDVLELLRLLQLFSEECFQEFVFWQRADIQDHVVPVILELLEIVPF